MSHYNVAVFTRNGTQDELETLLAPYDEDVEPDSPYAEFEEDEDGELDEATGKRGYWSNPNAKWDWFVWGGRFRAWLKLKPGKTGENAPFDRYDKPFDYPSGCYDRALAADIDLSRDDDAYKRALRHWEVVVEGAKKTNAEKADFSLQLFKPEYYIRRYDYKEFYADCMSSRVPYAYLTADGEWRSPGRMGWFGCDDVAYAAFTEYIQGFREYLKTAAEQGLTASVMDLHI